MYLHIYVKQMGQVLVICQLTVLIYSLWHKLDYSIMNYILLQYYIGKCLSFVNQKCKYIRSDKVLTWFDY